MFNMEEGNSGAFPRLVFHIADVVESPSWLFSDLGQSLVQWTLCWLLMLSGFAWLDRVLLSWRTRIKDNERWWKYILKLGQVQLLGRISNTSHTSFPLLSGSTHLQNYSKVAGWPACPTSCGELWIRASSRTKVKSIDKWKCQSPLPSHPRITGMIFSTFVNAAKSFTSKESVNFSSWIWADSFKDSRASHDSVWRLVFRKNFTCHWNGFSHGWRSHILYML